MPWSPVNLILAGDTGGWFDPSDYSRTFQDAAGTVPVTGISQSVGRMTTGAGAGSACFDLTQATSSAQPKSHSDGLLHDGTDWLDSGLERFGDTGLYCAAGEAFTVAISYATLPTFGTLIARASAVSADKTFQLFRGGGGYLIELRGAQTTVTGMGSAATVVIFRWDGSQAQITVNGGSWQACTVGTSAENNGQRIIVGARTNGTGLLLPNNARPSRLFFLDRAITDTETSYLKYQLGQSVGLSIGVAPPAGGTLPVSKSATVAWSCRSRVSGSFSVAWSRRARLQATQTLSWQRWHPGGVSLVTGVHWSRKSSASIAAPASWSRNTSAGSARSISWSRRARIAAVRPAVWSRRERVANSGALSWHRYQRALASADVSWLREALGAVARGAGVFWQRRQGATVARSVSWARWQQVVPGSVTLAWARRRLAAAGASCSWHRHARIADVLHVAWSRESDVQLSVPAHRTLAVPVASRSMNVAAGNRRLSVAGSTRILRAR